MIHKLILIFCFLVSATLTAGATATEEKIPEASSTSITCVGKSGGFTSTYYLWLPPGYNEEINKERTYPILVVDNANGKSQGRLKSVLSWVEDNQFICIMPVEVKNGDMKPIVHHYENIMDDIGKRLRICKYAGVITGSSGGSRRADRMGQTYNKYFGGVLHSAATGTMYKKSRHMFSATVLGDHDYNIGEMNAVWQAFKKKGYYRWSPQGHGWYPNDMGRRAFDWLCVQILQRKKSPVPAAAATEMFKALIKQADSQNELSEQLTYRNWIAEVAKVRADLMKNADIKTAVDKNKQNFTALLKEKDGQKNWKSLLEWEKFHQKEMIQNFCKSCNFMQSMKGDKNKKIVIAKTAKTRKKIIKNLTKFIEKYKDTEGARLAEECKDQLERFDTNWS